MTEPQTVNWSRRPYTRDEFIAAWEDAEFANDAAQALGLRDTSSSSRPLVRLAESLGLEERPVWSRKFSREEFRRAWEESMTARDAARVLGTQNSTSFRKLAEVMGLPEKDSEPVSKDVVVSSDEFRDLWDQHGDVDHVAMALERPVSEKSCAQLNTLAASMGLERKPRWVPVTETGDDAGTLVGQWIDWYRDVYGVDPLKRHIGLVSKQVRELIIAGYPSVSIKYGIYKWTLAVGQGGFADGSLVTREAHQHLLGTTSAGANAQQLASIDQPVRQIEERVW